jgi:hypothetical protein
MLKNEYELTKELILTITTKRKSGVGMETTASVSKLTPMTMGEPLLIHAASDYYKVLAVDLKRYDRAQHDLVLKGLDTIKSEALAHYAKKAVDNGNLGSQAHAFRKDWWLNGPKAGYQANQFGVEVTRLGVS